MRTRQNIFFLFALLIFSAPAFGQTEGIKLVTPHASPEAKALLQFLYTLSGNHTLTGQHNFRLAGDRNSKFATEYSGKVPVIWGTDFGFAKANDKDSYLLRKELVQQAEEQYKNGAIVALCWHAVPPTANEPVTFQPFPGADTLALASVQGRLTDQQFKDVLTPGTALYNKWAAQVDTIAFYLKQLQAAHVPVLWRPYHEMNGSWFWWGGRTGKYSTQALYRQIFDRLVNYHKLNNLVWVWSVDRPGKPEMAFNKYYPGNKYLDILALDVYSSDFKQDYYDGLNALSNGKLLTLAEVGNPPTSEILAKQPRWSYWMIWAGMVRNTSKKQYEAFANDPRILGLDDPYYINALNPFRIIVGLPALPLTKPINFTGDWVLNEDKSNLGNFGSGNSANKMTVVQDGNALSLKRSYVQEWSDPRVIEDKMTINGDAADANAPNITIAKMAAHSDTLTINSKMTMKYGGPSFQVLTKEVWSLQNKGKALSIVQTSTSPRGDRKVILVYDKQ
jgi:mannan endo-1,4-beta-mannosidase